LRKVLRFALWAPAALSALAALAVPARAEVKQFRDWLAACDNTRRCAAYALRENGGSRYLRIERGGEAEAPIKVTLVAEGKIEKPLRAAFNDPALGGLPAAPLAGKYLDDLEKTEFALPSDLAFIDALRKATELTTTPEGGEAEAISLSGAVASLLWIDEQQKRLGTVTALVRRGDKPASAVPPPPAIPVVRRGTPATEPAPKDFPKPVLAKGRTVCGADDPKPEPGDAIALGGNLVGYWFECRQMSGAYNFWSGLVIAPHGAPQAARIPWIPFPPGEVAITGIKEQLLVNAAFDEKTMTLTMFAKSRGPGDCGSAAAWVFDGKEFRLTRFQKMPVCAGLLADEWPVIYRAEVK
jgi:hypothetical protein